MNKNELKDDIKNALEDLKDDYTTYSQRYEDLQDMNTNKLDIPKSLLMTELYNFPERLRPETERAKKRASLEKHFSKTELEKMNIQDYYGQKNDRSYISGFAGFQVIFPHIAGIIIGCAFARMFNFAFIGYVIMGIICAFLVGVHKSTYSDKIALKYAVIKNIVLMVIEIILCLLFFVVGGIIYMMK